MCSFSFLFSPFSFFSYEERKTHVAPLYDNHIVSYKEETIMKTINTINVQNVNVNNSVAHLNALTKQREELVKKLAAIDAEIKETRKTIEVKQAVLKLQKEYADKAAALKKEYDNKIKALVGDDTPDPDPQPESPKPEVKSPAKETVSAPTAPAKKAESAPKAPAAKAESKDAAKKAEPKAAPAQAGAKAHNKSQFLHEINVDSFQKTINSIPKEEAGEAILHAALDGSKEQFAALANAVLYGYQNGVKKFWFTYSEPEFLDAVSEEMAAVLEAGQRFGFIVKVTQRCTAPAAKAEAPQNVKAQGESSAKADRTSATAPKAFGKKQKRRP